MALVSFSNVSKTFNNDLILDHVSFNIFKNEKVALIGDNGTGKTTILKLILHEIEPTLMAKEDKPGDILLLKGLSIGYLSQNAIRNLDNTVLEELEEPFKDTMKLENDFNQVVKELSENPEDEYLLEKYNKYLAKLEESRSFSYKNEIETLVSKFSFPLSILNKNVKELSGGERMKIAFIKLLLFKHDLLLLDEPTNHLDISTIEWLEDYLKTYKGTILFISHDRYFLESLATKIIELENQRITTYNTTYNNYLTDKENNYQHLLAISKREEEEMEKLKKFIEYYMPKPRFVSRAKDRVKKLEKLEANHVEPPKKVNHNISFKLEGGNLKNKLLIEVKDLVVGYDKPLLPKINFTVYGKDKIAIIGDNGIGKTTLIKTILEEIKPIAGEIVLKRLINYGYIQQNDHSFKPGSTIIEHLRDLYPNKLDKELRTALGRFLFRKEEVFKACSTLSNGEKMRVNLCALMLSSYDILILDEPTNHLDMVTKECLIKALKDYSGAILFISHDRYFINELADFTLYLEKEKVLFNEGNYDDLKLVLDPSIVQENKKDSKNELVYDKIEKKEKLSNNKIQEYKKKLKDLEEQIEGINILLEEDFEDYKKIEELSNHKEELETEYIEIMEKLGE